MRISLCPRVRKLRCRDRFSTKLSKREQQKQVVRTGRVCQGPRVGPTNAPRRAVPRGRSRKALPSEPGSACVRGHNRAAQPERLRGHTFILARPGGRTSEMQVRAGLVPAEPLSWACGRVPSPRLYLVDPLRVSLKTLSPKLVPNASRGCGARPVNVERHSSAQQKRCRFSTK